MIQNIEIIPDAVNMFYILLHKCIFAIFCAGFVFSVIRISLSRLFMIKHFQFETFGISLSICNLRWRYLVQNGSVYVCPNINLKFAKSAILKRVLILKNHFRPFWPMAPYKNNHLKRSFNKLLLRVVPMH